MVENSQIKQDRRNAGLVETNDLRYATFSERIQEKIFLCDTKKNFQPKEIVAFGSQLNDTFGKQLIGYQ